jgi:hypothetical protein
MDYSFQGIRPPPQLVAIVANTNDAYEDKKCYDDSSTNAHITPDLDNLNIQKPFQNTNTVAMGNGASLIIANNGSTILHSSHNSKSVFILKKKMCYTILMLLPISYPFNNSVWTMDVILS